MQSYRSEQAASHRHYQRSRYPFTRHVTNDEVQLFVFNEEVVQVSPYLFGRHQLGMQGQVIAFREGREKFRKHTHLYVMGNSQLALYSFLIGCCRFQFINVFHQRMLEVLKRVMKFLEFILRFYLRKFGFEISMGNLLGHIREVLHRSNHSTDSVVVQQDHEQQCNHTQHNEQVSQHLDLHIQFASWTNNGNYPLRCLYRRVEDKEFLSTLVSEHFTGTAVHHIVLQFLQRFVFIAVGRRKDGFVEQQVRVRMHDIRSIPAHHQVIGVLEHLNLANQLGQPFQRKVGRNDGIELSFTVVQRFRVGSHHLLATPFIVIRLAPIRLVQQLRNLVPVHVVVVVRFGTQLHRLDFSILIPIRIRREEMALRREVIRFKRYRTTIYKIIVLEQAFRHVIHEVGRFQSMRYNPSCILYGNFHGMQYRIYLVDGAGEFTVCMLGRLLSHLVSCHSQENGECQREDDSRNNQHSDHQSARDGLSELYLCFFHFLPPVNRWKSTGLDR